MNVVDIAALQATPVSESPFPHIVVPNFVPPAVLPKIVAGLPPMSKGGSFPPESVKLGAEARSLMTALEGQELRHAIADKFALDLAGAPTMVTVRGWTREKDGRIHCDSTAKRVTVLLYLNPDPGVFSGHQGCLRLLHGPDDIEDFAVEVPPVNGTLLVFPNGPTTWHGHKQFVGQRYSVQLNYMTTDQHARSELRRHRVSAVLKRVTSAA